MSILVYLFSLQIWSGSSLKAPFDNEASQDGDEFSNREGSTDASSIIFNALVVNGAQLLVSVVYVTYNGLLTRMLSFNEYSRFATRRHTLRVSRPVGQQRSTYYLQVPYRYSVPFLISMMLLHWLISRGLYLVNVHVYDISGMEIPTRARYGRGMSPLPLLLAFLLSTAMWVVLFVLMRKRLGTGMPIIGTCSAAISAACHPVMGDGSDATKGLMYGVVLEERQERQERCDGLAMGQDQAEAGSLSFSSGDVQPLVVGTIYSRNTEKCS
jgi:hypothetical protein